MRAVACILALATAGATLTTAATAFAQDRMTIAVPYWDLNLDAPAGRATLKARLEGAARRACGSVSTGAPMDRVRRYACRADALAEADSLLAATVTSSGQRLTAR